MTNQTKCGQCGASSVRLYRPYGEFRRPERDRCNGCLDDGQRKFYVPLLPDEDGEAWGFTSTPTEAIDEFFALPEANVNAPGWTDRGFRP